MQRKGGGEPLFFKNFFILMTEFVTSFLRSVDYYYLFSYAYLQTLLKARHSL